MTLYAADLDGTLLCDDKTIAPRAAVTLNRLISEGVCFTYATARSFSSASPLVKQLSLTCPAVIFNGVFVVDPKTGEHIIENVPSKKSIAAAREFTEVHRLAPLVYSYIEGKERVSYLKSRRDEAAGYIDDRKGDARLRAVDDYDRLFEGDVFYLTFFDPADPSALDGFFDGKNGFSRNVQRDTYTDMIWYEVFSEKASKAGAVRQVMELIKADSLVTFGDNLNDISMIEAADTGAAVLNACEELKSRADIIIGSNNDGAVAEFIERREAGCSRWERAVGAALLRERGMNGSVGTQKEKLIHAALKNYYAPHLDEQEIRIGRYIADAVTEDGIYEIQTRSLYLLRDKLTEFTPYARVNVVYPMETQTRTVFINENTGEIMRETPFRGGFQRQKLFKELYSLRGFIPDKTAVIIVKLKVEKRVYIPGEDIPDLRNRSVRKKLRIEKYPLAIIEEIRLSSAEDYAVWLPDGLPERFTKKEFVKAAREGSGSLRLEVLRAARVIAKTGNIGRNYVYKVNS